ncbi:hypothetical protein ACFFTN_01500 [Aminobacter aganoensis]|uniref:Uncharacterized protein n=1 Tax=Aminobacter aganoensis TaxID=83264 RepID=A0A7X0F5E5_9HYPH|nr:hypothetical protein [Aminobacter aganoensis]MBB6353463.1 hypothetical protein [Aminobacter aganoensis]
MSGVVSSIGKAFTSVVSGVAKVGKAVLGVGASVFTGGAAAGAGGLGSIASGGGVLGNILSGASKIAGNLFGPPGMAQAAGGLFSSAGLAPAATATGLSPLGKAGGGLLDFLKSETGAGLISGIGGGLMEKAKLDAYSEEQEKDRGFLRAKEQRITDSYNVPDAAFAGNTTPPPAATAPQQPAAQAMPGAPKAASQRFRYDYDPQSKRIVRVAG